MSELPDQYLNYLTKIIVKIIIITIIIIIIIIIIIFPETRKYWIDVQWGIVSSHGQRDPL